MRMDSTVGDRPGQALPPIRTEQKDRTGRGATPQGAQGVGHHARQEGSRNPVLLVLVRDHFSLMSVEREGVERPALARWLGRRAVMPARSNGLLASAMGPSIADKPAAPGCQGEYHSPEWADVDDAGGNAERPGVRTVLPIEPTEFL